MKATAAQPALAENDMRYIEACIMDDIRRIETGRKTVPKPLDSFTVNELKYAAQMLQSVIGHPYIKISTTYSGYIVWEVAREDEYVFCGARDYINSSIE